MPDIGNSNGIFVIFSFIVSLVVAFAATPLVRMAAFRLGAVDVPKDARRMHKRPIARLGGIAIFFGVLVSVVCFGQWMLPEWQINIELVGIVLSSFIIVTLGVFDDIKPRKAIIKLVVQIAAALIVVYSGVKVAYINNPFGDSIIVFPEWLAILISVIWIVGVTNAVNLIDGLDGLAVGVSSVASIALLSILLLQRVEDLNLLIMAAALAGACFGFVPYNLNPAKIFMGDTGSTFLGFMLACISIEGPFKKIAAFSVPLLVLGLPIFDTLFAILRRVVSGRPIMSPDRGHMHHRLVDIGLSQKQATAILVSFSVILGLGAIVLIFSGAIRAMVLIFLFVVFIVGGLRFMSNQDPEDNCDDSVTELSNQEENQLLEPGQEEA